MAGVLISPPLAVLRPYFEGLANPLAFLGAAARTLGLVSWGALVVGMLLLVAGVVHCLRWLIARVLGVGIV
jgi:hypothetical protein